MSAEIQESVFYEGGPAKGDLIFNLLLTIPGAILLLGGVYGWVMEPPDDPNKAHGHDDHDDPSPGLALAPVGAEEVGNG